MDQIIFKKVVTLMIKKGASGKKSIHISTLIAMRIPPQNPTSLSENKPVVVCFICQKIFVIITS
jgi:hypothetical protein